MDHNIYFQLGDKYLKRIKIIKTLKGDFYMVFRPDDPVEYQTKISIHGEKNGFRQMHLKSMGENPLTAPGSVLQLISPLPFHNHIFHSSLHLLDQYFYGISHQISENFTVLDVSELSTHIYRNVQLNVELLPLKEHENYATSKENILLTYQYPLLHHHQFILDYKELELENFATLAVSLVTSDDEYQRQSNEYYDKYRAIKQFDQAFAIKQISQDNSLKIANNSIRMNQMEIVKTLSENILENSSQIRGLVKAEKEEELQNTKRLIIQDLGTLKDIYNGLTGFYTE